jgi:predicted phage terminase large subunit-like protein
MKNLAHSASFHSTEKIAPSKAWIKHLRAEGVPVHGNRPVGDKVVRMSAQTARIEEGRVFLPESAPWLEEFRSEILAFPNGRHDDQVDSLAQALAWFTKPWKRTLAFG